jgi:DNA-directed RNA polymerase specialized sigma24 family protein
MLRTISALCLDLADLRPVERRLLLLHVEYGLTPEDLAEVYQVAPSKVERVLAAAWRKYGESVARLRW